MPSSVPQRIVDLLVGAWPAAAVRAAVSLNLFTTLAGRPRTAADIARSARADAVRIERLCDYLTAAGWLRKRGTRYEATREAARDLSDSSPESLAGAARCFLGDDIAAVFRTLGDRRAGRTRTTAPPAFWRAFARDTFALRARYAALMAAALIARGPVGPRVLDIGAGASPLGLALATRRRNVRLTVQDHPAVVPVALERARAAGVARRVTAIRGDARTVSLGGPYDLALLVNVLEYIPARDRRRLLARIRAALAPGGAIAIGAPLFNGRRTGPPDASAYDLLLLALGSNSRPSTFTELKDLLQSAGFGGVVRVPGQSLVIAVRQEKT